MIAPDPSPRSVTLRDVAAVAHVSISTACLALQGSHRIRADSRKRVQDAARDLGYTKNAAGSLLATCRGRRNERSLVPIVLVSTRRKFFASECEEIAQQGYAIRYASTSAVNEHHLDQWYAEGVKGVILGNCAPQIEVDLSLPWERSSVVSMSESVAHGAFETVEFDRMQSAIRLWELARERGYQRIGLAPMMHSPPLMDDHLRVIALLGAQAHFAPQDEVLPPFLGLHNAVAEFADWFKRVRPDCVIGFHTGVYWWVQELDPSCGFATLHLSPEVKPTISGMNTQDKREIHEAIILLNRLIRLQHTGPPASPRVTRFQTDFHEGTTLGWKEA